MEATQFERYWPIIEPHTFASVMLPLSRENLSALRQGYEQRCVTHEPQSQHSQPPALTEVAHKIEEGMARLGKRPGIDSVFVRLSSRSPKDALLLTPTVDFEKACRNALKRVRAREAELYEEHPELPSSSPFNQILQAQYIASTALLGTSSGQQALDYLLHSLRIQEDLALAEERMASESVPCEDCQFNLVVRELGAFHVRNEVRGFVYRSQFTALTQYNEMVFFPQTLLDEASMVANVTRFMDHLIPQLEGTLESFVVDLVLLENDQVRVIEVNPFAEYAGSGLFAWEKRADLEVLLGRRPFEYRMVTCCPKREWVSSKMNHVYRNIAERILASLDEE
jgi:hypothetical protein